ncbi:MAG TPA: DUF4129 domain-containing protein [Terriglobales bacterium]|nr:DUF4129 domain-containing protein [Terriglobales bacterium]
MCFALVCVGLAMLATVAPAETTVDLPTYIADLQHWSAAVADLPAHPETAAGLRRSVPLQLDLNVTGQHFKLSNVWLVMALAQWEKQAPRRPALQRDMQQRLQWQLQQALALNRPPPTPSSETARAQLRAILSRREFRFVQPPSWWDLMVARVRRWLLRWVEKLMNRLHLKPGVASIFSWILLSAAFLLLAWMLWRNLRRASRDMTKLGLQAPISNAWGWRQWAEAARAAAAEQRYREAIHCCYWAAVFRLEQMGVWRLNVARTPREYLRLLPPGSQHRAAMASLTRRLEAVWYGYRTVTPAEVQSALQELENLECNSPSIAATASY